MANQLEIIIPVYNEEENLPQLVDRIDVSLKKASIKYGIIIIDDHSTDNTSKVVKTLQKKYPIIYSLKQGNRGKAYSVIEGAQLSTAQYLAMIDADLQYPPEMLPEMLNLMETHGVVVARRKSSDDRGIRHLASKGFQFFFGRVLYGLTCDIQSGLKMFRRDTILHLDASDVTAWTIDIPLLHTALEQGHSIGEVDIHFAKREHGESKIKLVQSIREIGGHAVKYRLKNKKPIQLAPQETGSMKGAGVVHKHRSFITHTTLGHHHSAMTTFTFGQKTFIAGIFLLLFIGALTNFVLTLKIFVGVLSFIYFVDVIFNLFLITRSLHNPPELSYTKKDLEYLQDKDLPMYTILCPLYKEANVLPHFLESIAKMDWPKEKLDVLLLLEEDDKETVEVAEAMDLPSYVRIIVVPDSQPKTKPKACNYGLHFAKGEYLVIYDAEDIPDPLQLKKVFHGFQNVPANVRCLQAKLNYHNPHQNLLTRFFTAEYSLWFDVVLTGLQSINTTIPLGGTSNHFRTEDLQSLQGWDPFNVTEDCDLGIRLFKRGFKTAVVDSITLEEANSNWGNWLRQRSRWIKGYMQTYLIHMRNPVYFFRKNGFHALLFQLVVGGKLAFMFINPIMWALTISYFTLYAYVGETIESFYPSIVFYMAVTSLLFGNFLFIYYYMIGAAKREHWTLLKWVFLVPFYWLMVSWAACIALKQLITNPHYWEKTIHGLHLKKKEVEKEAKEVSKVAVSQVIAQGISQKDYPAQRLFHVNHRRLSIFKEIFHKIQAKRRFKTIFQTIWSAEYRSGVLLVFASLLANVLNMATNFYMGARLSLVDFGQMVTFMSLLYMINIPLVAFGSTINHHTAIILGKAQAHGARDFWYHWIIRAFFFGLIVTGLWLFFSPQLTWILKFNSILPILIFTPLLLIGLIRVVNEGYLRGQLVFGWIALIVAIEPIVRLLLTVLFGETGLHEYVYLSIPIASALTALVSFFMAKRSEQSVTEIKEFHLPFIFFILASVASLSTIAFFSLDNLLVATFLNETERGVYGLLGLVGKMIFFAGSLTAGFILPLVSRKEGEKKDSSTLFLKLFTLTAMLSGGAYLTLNAALMLFIQYNPLTKLVEIQPYLPLYGLGILAYTLSQAVVQYHLAKREYVFATISFLLTIIQVIGLSIFHRSIDDVVMVMFIVGMLNAVILFLVHWKYHIFKQPLANIYDFFDLFKSLPRSVRTLPAKDAYRILIFNWRDTKHVWGGGAEVYIHEMSKRLVQRGHRVTVFCGNDGKHPRNEVIDGVQIVRRGGFYTVYFWAFIYYITRFRNLFDVVIDSENGIPFFTPLYVKQPIFLLIHHVHQEVFRKHLTFPASEIAAMIESDFMPLMYKNHRVITVSDSSKKEIISLGLGSKDSIEVINPGIEHEQFSTRAKTKNPSFIYVGRLKPYKNVDVAIKAFAKILPQYPKATFTIAGSGESWNALHDLVNELGLQKSVTFVSHPDDNEKIKLLGKSWVAIQPSMIEGWGITVIEANACATPVIASNVKGLRDSVVDGKTGILVKAKHIGEMAEAMEMMIKKDALRNKMSRTARTWSKQFSWDNSVANLVSIIEEHQPQHAESEEELALAKVKSYEQT